MSKIQRMFQQCSIEAEQSDMTFRHGCVVEKGGKILSKGFNHSRTKINGRNYCSTHAEMVKTKEIFTKSNLARHVSS